MVRLRTGVEVEVGQLELEKGLLAKPLHGMHGLCIRAGKLLSGFLFTELPLQQPAPEPSSTPAATYAPALN